MTAHTDPTDRWHEGYFSYASCEDSDRYAWGEEEGDGALEDVPFDGLVPFFTEHAHPNLPVALSHLMDEHNVKVTCSMTVINEGDSYWTTGEEDVAHNCKIAELSSGVLLSPVGHLEQILSAGLACVYLNGAQARHATKELPHFFSAGYNPPDDLCICFKFQGRKVFLQMMSAAKSRIGRRVIHIQAGSW